MFKKAYEKFLKTVEDYDIISKDTGKIVIATSGGKDGNVMTAILNEYKNKERPDLELELANVLAPGWKYKPETYLDIIDDEEKRKILLKEKEYLDKHKKYWKERGINTVEIDDIPGIDDKRIFDSSNPCMLCFIAMKKALFKYLEKHDDKKEVRLAMGLIKSDVIYSMLNLIARSGGKSWQETKSENPAKYKMDLVHLATFSPYPKIDLGIPNKTIYGIKPITAISDSEAKALATELELPVMPDFCISLFGAKFQSGKRHFDRYLRITAVEESNLLNKSLDPLFPDYNKLFEMYYKSGMLPPIEELNGILYESYFQEILTEVIDDAS